jgi:hypothetical protein
VHIFKDGKECKLWLEDLSVAFNRGHSAADLRGLAAVAAQERLRLLEVWHDHFG